MTAALLLATALAAAPRPQPGVNLAVTEPTQGPVVSLLGDVVVSARVEGDVVALAGSVRLETGADVTGEAVAIGGEVTGPGTVRGRSVSFGSQGAGAARSPAGLRAAWGLRLLRLGGWVLLGTLLVVAVPRAVRAGAVRLALHPVRVVLVGAATLGVWLAGMMLAAIVVRSPVGAGVLVLGAVLLLVAKTAGIVVAAWWLGWRCALLLPAPLRGELPRTGVAVAVLVAASLLPVLGGALWIAANVAGIGTIAWGLVHRLSARSWLPLSSGACELA